MSTDHKVTVVFYGLTPAGGMLLFNQWRMRETGEGNDLEWWDDAAKVCENCGTVVHECSSSSGDLDLWCCPCAGLDVSELHNDLLLFVYFSEHSRARGCTVSRGKANNVPHSLKQDLTSCRIFAIDVSFWIAFFFMETWSRFWKGLFFQHFNSYSIERHRVDEFWLS